MALYSCCLVSTNVAYRRHLVAIIDDSGRLSTTSVAYERRNSGFIQMIRFRLAELIADKSFKERRVVTVSEIA